MCKISDRMIAIDTEYHCDDMGKIDNVYCVCTSDNKGSHFKKWTSGSKDADILTEIAGFHGIENPIFVCHAFDKAERRALKFLGVENREHDYICTWHLAKMLQNSFSKRSDRIKAKAVTYESDTEAALESSTIKAKAARSLSYAGLCKSLLEVDIDTEHKEEMRKLCILNLTRGNEQQIMDYCADDTKYLLPLLEILSKQYYAALKGSFCPLRPGLFDSITFGDCFDYLVKQASNINLFGEIADKGLPVDMKRVAKVKRNALKYREQMKADFNAKYPESFITKKDGLLHENTVKTQAYLSELLKAKGLSNSYPKSDKTGKWSMSSDTLKDYFRDQDNFGEHYRLLNKMTRLLNGVSKQSDSPFNYIADDKLWYESLQPYGTITSRCTPSTKRFVFGWHKSLYGIMNPKPGKWLVELDFGSEETFVQCCICQDSVYNDIYNSKDIYLAFANKMRLIPDEDWNNLPKGELKEKYSDVRKRIKSLVLGLSYGMGAEKLAKRLGLSQQLAEGYCEMFSKILHRSTQYKSRLGDLANHRRAFSLPDGFICATAKGNNNTTTVGNWPFQSAGGSILRVLVRELDKRIQAGLKANVLATIHDAIFFEVDEGDMGTINTVAEIMRTTANKVLHAPKGWSMKVGEADVIKHGDIWCTDNQTFVEQFKALLNYQSK